MQVPRRSRIRICLSLVPLALMLGGIGCDGWPPSRFVIPQEKRIQVDAAAFQDAHGRRFTLDTFRGKVILLQLWSPRVPLSRDVLPEIAGLQAKADDRAVVLAVSMDPEGFPGARTYLQEHPDLKLEVVIPDGPAALAPFGNWSAVPSTLVVDRQGRLRERWNGHLWDRASKALRAALKE